MPQVPTKFMELLNIAMKVLQLLRHTNALDSKMSSRETELNTSYVPDRIKIEVFPRSLFHYNRINQFHMLITWFV